MKRRNYTILSVLYRDIIGNICPIKELDVCIRGMFPFANRAGYDGQHVAFVCCVKDVFGPGVVLRDRSMAVGGCMAEAKRGGRPPKITRQEIVDAALKIGLDRATVRAIAEELNVTSMTIYNHFGKIEEIIDFCIMSIIRDVMDVLTDDDTFEDTLEKIGVRYYDILCENRAVIFRVIDGNIFPEDTAAWVDRLVAYGIRRGLTAGEALFALRSVVHAAAGCAVTRLSIPATAAAAWIDPAAAMKLDSGKAPELNNLKLALMDQTLNVLDPMSGIKVVLHGLRAMFGDRMTAPASASRAASGRQ